MTTPSVVVIDTLNSLLEAEANSIFHFVGEGSPYLKDAAPSMRQKLEMMRRNLDRHELEIAALIRKLSGQPSAPPKPDAHDQYLSFLSLKFLLPKLVDAKRLMIERYEHASNNVSGDPAALALLSRHDAEMKADLEVLETVAAEVSGSGGTHRAAGVR